MNLVVIFLVPLMTGLTIGQGICLHFTGPNLDVWYIVYFWNHQHKTMTFHNKPMWGNFNPIPMNRVNKAVAFIFYKDQTPYVQV